MFLAFQCFFIAFFIKNINGKYGDKNMYYEKTNSGNYRVGEWYKDPLTGKKKRAFITYKSNTSRARKQAERELEDKIDGIVNKHTFGNASHIKTWGQLRDDWLATWKAGVKRQTVERQELISKRVALFMDDDYMLEKMTPLFMKNLLMKYEEKYDASPATMRHIKSTFNKAFAHGVLYNVIQVSPMSAVVLHVPLDKKKAVKKRKDAKFLEPNELKVFLTEMSERRNPNYYDLCLFLLYSGLRIGEAGAIAEDDVDFENNTVDVSKTLINHDMIKGDWHYDEPKTVNSERYVVMPPMAMDILARVIKRSKDLDWYYEAKPFKSYMKLASIFRTEYGSPITSHAFREVIKRVQDELREHCKERYGFEWTKNVVPHSFRIIHITYLTDDDVPLKEVMERVGHIDERTTLGYVRRSRKGSEKALKAMNDWL